jgi:hypothetical protein
VVVGGEVGLLRSIEEGCGVVIDEMPIHVSVCCIVHTIFIACAAATSIMPCDALRAIKCFYSKSVENAST